MCSVDYSTQPPWTNGFAQINPLVPSGYIFLVTQELKKNRYEIHKASMPFCGSLANPSG
jgi:hypothetical protein